MSTPPQSAAPPQPTQQQAPPAQPPAAAAAPEPDSLRKRYADWPQKGDEREQPWDLDALKVSKSDRELEDGAPNTVSPIVLRHSFPILSSGSAGAAVGELARRLQTLGYATDITRGDNPYQVLTPDVHAAVERFREDYGVQEDPTAWGGNTQGARVRASAHVGPYTWEALLRASDRAAEEE